MPNKKEPNKELMQYAGLATQWLVLLGLALWAGMAIDKHIGPQSRILTVLLPLLALTVSLYQLIKKFNKPNK
jgi:hypothetical protein